MPKTLTPDHVDALTDYCQLTVLDHDLIHTLRGAWKDLEPQQDEAAVITRARGAMEMAKEYIDSARSGKAEVYDAFCSKYGVKPGYAAASDVLAVLNDALEAFGHD